MDEFSEFAVGLLEHGTIVFRSAGPPRARPTGRSLKVLAGAFAVYAETVAGPPIAFDERAAVSAAEVARQSAWALLHREARLEELPARLETLLRLDANSLAGISASRHLSADLTLRFLPQIARRAGGIDADDPLIVSLTKILRSWPLSGALSDIEGPPLAPLDFGGHPGLLLLYAERLADHDRPSWRPSRDGPARDAHELVQFERARAGRASMTGGNRTGGT